MSVSFPLVRVFAEIPASLRNERSIGQECNTGVALSRYSPLQSRMNRAERYMRKHMLSFEMRTFFLILGGGEAKMTRNAEVIFSCMDVGLTIMSA